MLKTKINSSASGFNKLLVANRGEIAARVLRSARALGLKTVAVFSQADADAEYLALADETICIGAAAPASSYLAIENIIAAARKTEAEAIHPGYGFLSENAGFAEACAAAGIVFVGPPASAIRAMGDKAGAKALMEAAGVPCVPGYQGTDQSLTRLQAEADRIGYPVMIKATAGGGGRGMRLVPDAESFAGHLASAKSEAKTAFNNDIVLLEKAIIDPRHVEIQIMADRFGNVIHLGERDCSVQRRHQKVIEEAPSPAVDNALRQRMGRISTDATKAIGYEGAGTFEYLLDAEGTFYFMEMNTRLQVEHPVTEAITGLDLVSLQLQIAMGQPLTLGQDDVSFSGHAIEARLCAEDPDAGFMPQSGVLSLWQPPADLRCEHALRSGIAIPPYYDSMIAKLVAHGADRDAARRSLARGLDETLVLGIRTNRAFLARCLRDEDFAAGIATTGFIEAHRARLLPDPGPALRRAGALLTAVLHASPQTALVHGYPTPVRLARDGQVFTYHVHARPFGVCKVTGDAEFEVVVLSSNSRHDSQASDISARIDIAGVQSNVLVVLERNRLWFHGEGASWDFEDLRFAPMVTTERAGDGKVRASMNGTVMAIDVTEGDAVVIGQKVLVLEAMKMEHAHTSNVAGRVAAIHVGIGDQVDAHRIVIEVEPA